MLVFIAPGVLHLQRPSGLVTGVASGALFLAALTKRALLPFRSWLPMAMRAPTPVSSLVHRRTLVTAGVFLFFKYFRFLGGCLWLLVLLGRGTMLVGGAGALAEKDVKKIVALRTLSQVGFLGLALGLGLLPHMLLHLLCHAFFKSCMFLQVGAGMLGS